MPRFIFDQTIQVHRLNLYDYKEEYGLNGTIKGVILPVKAEDVMISDGNPAKMFKLVCDIHEDLKEADKVVCDGETYIVKVVRDFKFRSLSHRIAFINKPNN